MSQNKIIDYYSRGIEKTRLTLDHFKLEGVRTKQIINRYLPDHPINILDVGGGAGFYSFWLKEKGHQVSLVDLSSDNIKHANEYASQQNIQLDYCGVADARNLNFTDNHFDLVLLMGPLYHIIDKDERLKAISEVKRVLKRGGVLLAAVISRYASLFDGFRRDLIDDDAFEHIVTQDLETGIHLNDTENDEYFTTAFFHTPDEIINEIYAGGLVFKQLIAIESIGWMIDRYSEKSKEKNYFDKVDRLLNAVESKMDIIALSPHIMVIAEKDIPDTDRESI